MSRKDFLTLSELKDRLHKTITVNKLPYDVDLMMTEISRQSFTNVHELKLIKINGYKTLMIQGQDSKDEVRIYNVSFQDGPKVFIEHAFPL